MAVVNVKSTLVSNADATPRVPNDSHTSRGDTAETVAVVSVGASDSATSTYRYGRIRSGARVSSIQVLNDANTAGTSYKCGVLFSAVDGGGTVVASSDTIFFSAVTMASARNVWTELLSPAIAGNSASNANAGLRVWELLGLSADPFKEYDLVITAVTPGTAGGNMAVKCLEAW